MELSSEQLTNYYFMDQTDPFESAYSSMVSSPTATPSSNVGDGMMIRELIGRLGSICDDSTGGEFSPQSCIATGNNSANNSCYSTPLNSPPPSRMNLSSLMMMANHHHHNGNFSTNLGSLNADPGFVERAAKFSCFGNVSNFANADMNMNANAFDHGSRSVPKLEGGKLSRVNSEKKMMSGLSRGSSPENGELGDSREGSSVSEQNPGGEMGRKGQNDANSRKRKSAPKAKVKGTTCSSPAKHDKVEAENEESNAKRSKVDNEETKKENTAGECNSNKEKQNNHNNNNSKEAEKPEPPKDYIHVRARRGQATDSHSLAERVRREKISERMKFLQDLVPGCNKVTGKATVLDEIINYVQSLQRQVEFLSMKLATVNPKTEFNLEALLSKDSRGSALPQSMYQLDQNSAQAFPFGYQATQQMSLPLPSNVVENPFSVNHLNVAGIRRNPSIPSPSMAGFVDSMAQLPTFWEDDLQSLVQMGIAQNQTQSVSGVVPNAQMKAEL